MSNQTLQRPLEASLHGYYNGLISNTYPSSQVGNSQISTLAGSLGGWNYLVINDRSYLTGQPNNSAYGAAFLGSLKTDSSATPKTGYSSVQVPLDGYYLITCTINVSGVVQTDGAIYLLIQKNAEKLLANGSTPTGVMNVAGNYASLTNNKPDIEKGASQVLTSDSAEFLAAGKQPQKPLKCSAYCYFNKGEDISFAIYYRLYATQASVSTALLIDSSYTIDRVADEAFVSNAVGVFDKANITPFTTSFRPTGSTF